MTAWLLTESPTVAVLSARTELRRLRMLVKPTDDAIRAELDRLEDVLARAITLDPETLATKGYVPEGDYVSRDEFNDEEKDRAKAEEEAEELRGRVHELETALDDSEDESKRRLTAALAEQRRLQSIIDKTPSNGVLVLVNRIRSRLDAVRPSPRSKVAREQWQKSWDAVEMAIRGEP